MANAEAQFRAFYNPNLRTESSFSLPSVDYGSGGGGLDIDGLLNKVAALKGAQSSREWSMRQQDKSDNARAQADALRYAEGQADRARYRDRGQFWQNLQALDQQLGPDFYGTRQLNTQPRFFNMPAASALTYGKDIFPNGFDTYSDIMRSSGGVSPERQLLAGGGYNRASGQGGY